MPADIKSIESTNPRCVRAALHTVCKFPSKAKLFETQTRLPISDQYATNHAAEESYARDYPDETRHSFNCHAHIECIVGDRALEVFPNECRGLLHMWLSLNFGALLQLKAAAKGEVTGHLSWYDSEAGAGEQLEEYRKQFVCGGLRHERIVRQKDHGWEVDSVLHEAAIVEWTISQARSSGTFL